jgi:hypothetical protein
VVRVQITPDAWLENLLVCSLALRHSVFVNRSELQFLLRHLSLVAKVRGSGPAVAVAPLLHISSPESCTDSIRESEEDTGDGNKLEEDCWDTKAMHCQYVVYGPCGIDLPSIGGLAALDELLLLLLLHLLELEVPRMRCWAELAALQNDKQNSANDRNEVQRKVHEVSDDGRGRELGEWLRYQFTELCDRVASRLDLSFVGDQRRHVTRHKRAIKDINQSIINHEVFA